MSNNTNTLSKYFSFKRILIPILIGLSITFFMIFKDINKPVYVQAEPGTGQYVWNDLNEDGAISGDELFQPKEGEKPDITSKTQTEVWEYTKENWKPKASLFFLLSILMVLIRDVSYMYRIRILTDKQLSWKQAFQVIVLWEFSSALTPSVVGGSAVALIIVSQEGIRPGRSTALVLITALLDELFYIIAVPLTLLLMDTNSLFTTQMIGNATLNVKYLFILGYSFIMLLTAIILVAVFVKPVGFKRVLVLLFSLKFLKKWRRSAIRMGDDIIITSRELKNKHFGFWFKAFGSTIVSWTARFLVLNCLIVAFAVVDVNQILVFGKQLVMWVILLISPTPGGSGIAEFMFPVFFKEFIPPGMTPALALLWRLLTYYPYIIVGAIVLPLWLKRVLKRKE